MKPSWKRFIIYLIAFIAMLPALLLRDFTPDNELRYVSIAMESIQNGTFFAFTNHGVPYADKPPLYMWICMLGYWLFGNNCLWFITLFSVIPAFVITEIMTIWASAVLPARWHNAAKCILLSSILFLGLALTMRMDMLMAMFIVLSLYVFFRMYKGDSRQSLGWLFPIYLFLGLFTKGPYGILVPLVSTILFLATEGKIRTIGRYWGWRTWTLLIGLSIIWFGAVFLEGGTGYLDNLLVKQTVGRAVNSFTHDEPFYYYLISVWYSLAPWSLAVIGTVTAVLCNKKLRRDTSVIQRFFLSTAGGTIILLSLVSSKLAVYLLPAFPFIIFAGVISLPLYKDNKWVKIALAVPMIILALLPISIPFVPQKFEGFLTMTVMAAVCVLSAGCLFSLVMLFRRKGRENMKKSCMALASSIYAFLFIAGLAIPDFNEHIGYSDLADKALRYSPSSSTPIYTYNVRRPENMDVYLGREIHELQRKDGENFIFPSSGILLIRMKDLNNSTATLAESGKYAIVKLTPNFKIDE